MAFPKDGIFLWKYRKVGNWGANFRCFPSGRIWKWTLRFLRKAFWWMIWLVRTGANDFWRKQYESGEFVKIKKFSVDVFKRWTLQFQGKFKRLSMASLISWCSERMRKCFCWNARKKLCRLHAQALRGNRRRNRWSKNFRFRLSPRICRRNSGIPFYCFAKRWRLMLRSRIERATSILRGKFFVRFQRDTGCRIAGNF